MQRFQNKVAIITGAASGMGAETARLLASEGAKVVITDVNLEKLTTIVAQIKKAGGKAIGVKHDVSNYEDWQNVVEMAKKEFKRIDILVNNAGISFPTLLEDTSEEEWEKVMDINATSIFLSHKAVLPIMKAQKSGSIINISSMASLVGNSNAGAYTASKGAVRSLTKAVAVDYAQYNIRSNGIYPGYIQTPMIKDLFKDPKTLKFFQANTPLPYFGEALDVAYAVLFLASDEAKFITGIELPVDGGVIAK